MSQFQQVKETYIQKNSFLSMNKNELIQSNLNVSTVK